MRRDDVQANLKIPRELRDRLKKVADQNRRSMTAEIVARLEESLNRQQFEEAEREIGTELYEEHLEDAAEEFIRAFIRNKRSPKK